MAAMKLLCVLFGDLVQETRYRQRYLDLMLNHEVRNIFKTRSMIINAVREFLNERDFLEVSHKLLFTVVSSLKTFPDWDVL